MNQNDGARTYFEKLKLIEKFCSGDTEVAKKILKGEYNDIITIKGRFKDDDDEIYGLFIFFISKITRTVVGSSSIISDHASVFQNKPFDSWKIFVSKLTKELETVEHDKEKTDVMNNVLIRLHELKFFVNIFDWINDNDIKNLTDRFERVVDKVLGIEKSNVVVDFEHITSLVLYETTGIKPISE